jgi:hypothetical protein
MRAFRLISVSFLLAFRLVAQTPLTEHQLVTYKGPDDPVRWATSYCDAVDDFSSYQTPAVFAMMTRDSSSKSQQWKSLSDRNEWEAAGKPAPLAFAWRREGLIVRVIIMSRPPRVWKAAVGVYRQTEYCYGADTKLIRIRAAWYAPTRCEFLFPCRLIAGHEFFLGGQFPSITDWLFDEDGQVHKLRNGRLIDDPLDPSYGLDARDLHLKTSAELPFRQGSQSPR